VHPTLRFVVIAVFALSIVACSDDADGDAAPGGGSEDTAGVSDTGDASDAGTGREETDGVVACSSLVGPIDAEVVATFTDLTADGFVSGCWLEGSDRMQMAGSLRCDDDRTVLVVGDRAGVEGGEWEPWDMDSGENATDALC
jgi:hypothetical protein